MAKRARILLADDHVLVVEAFERLLAPDYDIVGSVHDGLQLLEVAPKLQPDVIILDIKMPRLGGIEAARRLRRELPQAKVIFLTSSRDPVLAAEVIGDGAVGFLLKSGAGRELIQAIEAALKGQTYVTPELAGEVFAAADLSKQQALTPRQREVLHLLAEGLTMKQIAGKLEISSSTVAHHKYTMMESLGIASSAELIRFAIRKGF
ncbi:MAG: response regulator transcription factor [bacterium]|nr:response regulator transcription factor [bacterium]